MPARKDGKPRRTRSDKFGFGGTKDSAVKLMAQCQYTNTQIAGMVGVSVQCLSHWKSDEKFASAVIAERERISKEIRNFGIAVKDKRIEMYQDVVDRLKQVIAERGNAPEFANVPGGKTGLVTHKVLKRWREGEESVSIETYDIDSSLIRQLLDIAKQTSQELGQLTEKVEQVGTQRIEVQYVDANLNQDDADLELPPPIHLPIDPPAPQSLPNDLDA